MPFRASFNLSYMNLLRNLNTFLKYSLIFLFLAFISVDGIGQDPEPAYEEKLIDIFRTDLQFREMRVDSTLTKLDRTGDRIYFVYFFRNNYRMRAEYDRRMVWQMTYIFVPFERLPLPAQRHLEQNYGDFRRTSIRYQDAPEDSYYKVDVKKGNLHYQLRYNDDGIFMKAIKR